MPHFSQVNNPVTQKQGVGVSRPLRPQTTPLHILPMFYLQLRYKMSARRHL